MNIKAWLNNGLQYLGLGAINAVARCGQVDVSRLSYGRSARQAIDLYQHRDGQPRPLVIFYYGGAWQSGRAGDYRFVADTLAGLGFDVAIPDYRLYPEFRFSEIMDDARQAFMRILDAVPGGPVVILGHSAGAQMGALIALDGTEPGRTDPAAAEARLRGFVGLAGPYDFFPFTEDHHWDLFGPEEHYPASQPVNHVQPAAPELYLLHGEDDRRVRRGHSKSLMEKQQAVGGRAAREVYQKMGHVDIILQFSRFHRRGSPVVKDVARFISRVCEASQNNQPGVARPDPGEQALVQS